VPGPGGRIIKKKDGTFRAVFLPLAVLPGTASERGVPEFEHERAAVIPLVGIVPSRRVPVSSAPFFGQVVSGKPNLHVVRDQVVQIHVDDCSAFRELVKPISIRRFLEQVIAAVVGGHACAEFLPFEIYDQVTAVFGGSPQGNWRASIRHNGIYFSIDVGITAVDAKVLPEPGQEIQRRMELKFNPLNRAPVGIDRALNF